MKPPFALALLLLFAPLPLTAQGLHDFSDLAE